MLFVALLKVRAGTEQERIARRLKWHYPEEISVEGECWLQNSDPEGIIIFKTDSFASMMQLGAAWNDVYDVSIFPAVAAEEGLELARQMMG